MLERLRRATEACDTTYGEKSPEYSFIQGQKKRLLFILLLIVSTFFGACLAVSLGAVDVPLLDTIKILLNQVFFDVFGEPSESYYTRIIIDLRLPRVVLCILAGASLGMAGAVMQGLLRNPLVSPFTLGVSTAASFGAALAIVFGTTFLFGDFDKMLNSYLSFFQNFELDLNLSYVNKLFLIFFGALFIISFTMSLTNKTSDRANNVKKKIGIIVVLTLFSCFFLFMSDSSIYNSLIFMIFSLFYAMFFSEIKKTAMANIIIVISILSILFLNYSILF